ncbi:MAG: tRNA (N(6)-L-threonylcarbamoyladenosine(37)-C(2))-methylthiotransferase MtaB [Clostridia bacterium]|nr:tRNA (N(6)-L-threonylcarbamoyladenosine(37)-C(2))-methylthiotransferase MtaB [Clostridia bacterium]
MSNTINSKNIIISVFTLGCKTNYYESGQIVNWLLTAGYEAIEGLKWADIYVINTCAITKEAESKSRQAIARARKINPDCVCFIVGCASHKNAEQFKSIDNVQLILGNENKLHVVECIDKYIIDNFSINHSTNAVKPSYTIDTHDSTTQPDCMSDIPREVVQSHSNEQRTVQDSLTQLVHESNAGVNSADTNALLTDYPCYTHLIDATQGHTRAFIKIQDGCNNYCSYCIVPYLRSRSRSRSLDSIMSEVNANSSADEIVLIGIDISQYGLDINTTLAQLLTAMQTYKGRVRLGSLYCNCIDSTLLESMSINACKHFHLSLQSGCDRTLISMNRRYTTQQYADCVQLIRSYYPNAGITTDIIVGFSGESDEDFNSTVQFVRRMQFSDIHIFPYSPREGTRAYGLPRPTSAVVKDRVNTLTAVKRALKREFIARQLALGKATVLIEEYKNGYYVGYTDNYVKVFVKSPHTITGIVECTLLNCDDNGIYAQP